MISIYQLKPGFQNLLRPLVINLARWGITPNTITLSALVLSVLTGFLLTLFPRYKFILFFIPVSLFLRMSLNAIDGMLAREHNLKTALGAILNELGDVISDTALYLPFALIPGVNALLVVPVVVLSIISETAGICGVITGGMRRYDGPMGKSDRAFIFGLIAICLALGLTPGLWLNITWGIVLILLLVTIINRVKNSLNHDVLDAPPS